MHGSPNVTCMVLFNHNATQIHYVSAVSPKRYVILLCLGHRGYFSIIISSGEVCVVRVMVHMPYYLYSRELLSGRRGQTLRRTESI